MRRHWASGTSSSSSTPSDGRVFGVSDRVEIAQARVQHRRGGKIAAHARADAFDQLVLRGQPQALGGAAAVGAHEAADAELDAAEPARHDHRDAVHVLAFDRRENRPPRAAAGFAVVVEAVVRADPVRPAIVRRVARADAREERERGVRVIDRCGLGEEAAFPDVLLQAGFALQM